MHMSPTLRYELAQAPAGLRLTQDLLNTVSVDLAGQIDLLDNLQDAGRWLKSIDDSFAGRQLRKSDLARLRALRDYLRHTISAGAVSGTTRAFPSGSLSITVGPANGEVSVVPKGVGVERIVTAVLIERLFAERDGTWRRLKLCYNTACSLAFYDRTRNNNGVWHDVHVCGNAANLRASRSRRKGEKNVPK
jgi:predicted RNA-binding Zn ribbon-like protein